MSYFAVDDEMHFHRKFIGLSLAAIGLWVKCGSWSKKERTGGVVPMALVRQYKGTKQAAELCKVQPGCEHALWFKIEDGSGYQFHDWEEYQLRGVAMSPAERKAKSRAEKKRREAEQAAAALGRVTESHENRDSERDDERDQNRDNVTHLPARAHAHGVGVGVGDNSPSSTEHGDDPPALRPHHELCIQYAKDAGLPSDMDLHGTDRGAAETIVGKCERAGQSWRVVYARWRADPYVTGNRLPLTHLAGTQFPKYLADIAKPAPKGPAKTSTFADRDPSAPLLQDIP